MAASRLSDSQKQELVDRYRQGETGQALAQAYGCSPNTVSRVLKAALGAEELASLKKQTRGGGRNAAIVAEAPIPDPIPEAPMPLVAAPAVAPQALITDDAPPGETDDDEAPGTLAIDDADDFGDDGLEDDDAEELEALPLASAADPADVVLPRPLGPDSLPNSLYLLVDKTVELDVRPLREFGELGSLPDVNPRQAKRQCGRSQRVIKVPDSGVLQRTSRYLVAQGITRLVLEGGGLFAIPGG
jgi:hypothetical protein